MSALRMHDCGVMIADGVSSARTSIWQPVKEPLDGRYEGW